MNQTASVFVLEGMNTDVPPSSTAAAAIPASAPTVVVPANHGSVDTGIRLPVEHVALAELLRRQHADREAGQARAAAEAGDLDPLLPTNVGVLQRMVVELKEVVTAQRQRVAQLEQTVQDLVRRLQRRPRDASSPDQQQLVPDVPPDARAATADPQPPPAAAAAEAAAPSAADQEPKRPQKKNKGHGRRSLEELLKTLPRERREHAWTEAERLCPHCGRLRAKIGERTSHQVEYIPAQLVCIEHAQFTYSCPGCPEHIETAAKPPPPIDRGLAGPALCALVTASKFDDYLPLYRQELILSRYGLFLARSTLCDWLRALADLVKPLVDLMKDDVLQSRVVKTDGTSIEVLVEGQRWTRTGYFWPYLGDEAHPSVVLDFSLDKRKDHPQKFLADYTGYVQVDAYSAYDGCFLADPTHPKIEVGCWSHAEQYFEAALATTPTVAAEGLAFIGALFTLEAQAKRDHLGETEVLAWRQREAVPILDDFQKWLDQQQGRVLPKSPIADALRYTRNQWEALCRYTEAGFLAMDNNATERINKLIARARVNWLFVGSPRGGETAARLLSLVVTCRRLQMDSFAYLRDVFTRLPALLPTQLPELLPHRWLATHPQARHPPERRGHGHSDPVPRRKHRQRPT